MKKFVLLGAGALALAILPSASGPSQQVLAFHAMYAVDGPFLEEGTTIQGVQGDELPWVLQSAHGFLTTKGKLHVVVKGLVFSDDDKVPPDLQGINDEAEFRVQLVCLTETKDEQVAEARVETEGFAATADGDCTIDTKIDLPNPCIAPVLFVMSGSEDKWFAVSGVELEGD